MLCKYLINTSEVVYFWQSLKCFGCIIFMGLLVLRTANLSYVLKSQAFY